MFQQFCFGCFGKIVDRGKATDEAFKVRQDRGDLGLLQHDFTDPNAIRRRLRSPWQRTPVSPYQSSKRVRKRRRQEESCQIGSCGSESPALSACDDFVTRRFGMTAHRFRYLPSFNLTSRWSPCRKNRIVISSPGKCWLIVCFRSANSSTFNIVNSNDDVGGKQSGLVRGTSFVDVRMRHSAIIASRIARHAQKPPLAMRDRQPGQLFTHRATRSLFHGGAHQIQRLSHRQCCDASTISGGKRM